jgi:hypothetical protein
MVMPSRTTGVSLLLLVTTWSAAVAGVTLELAVDALLS